MQRVYIGYVQGTHGLRGDLKIKCRFENPDKVFVKNNTIYLNEEEHTITASKYYKGFYLVTIDNLKDINLTEKYIGHDVFIDRDELNLKSGEYILDDLYGMEVYSNGKKCGNVVEILNNGVYDILVIESNKKFMVPLVDEFIERVDLETNRIIAKDIEELMK